MRLNFFERLFIRSPIRRLMQLHFESRRLLSMGGPMDGGRALEVGCGPGGGIDAIYARFGADTVEAFDLDPHMIDGLRQRRGQCVPGALWAANVRHIPVKDARYDAVFNFGAIHHVNDWRSAICEISRVLKPGGRFYSEEILKRWITHPIVGRLMKHPQKDRFDAPCFVEALAGCGFDVIEQRQLADLYLWTIADKAI